MGGQGKPGMYADSFAGALRSQSGAARSAESRRIRGPKMIFFYIQSKEGRERLKLELLP